MNNFRKSIFVLGNDNVGWSYQGNVLFFSLHIRLSVCRLIRLYICMSWPEFVHDLTSGPEQQQRQQQL